LAASVENARQVQISWNEDDKSKFHSRRNSEQIKFMEYMRTCSTESVCPVQNVKIKMYRTTILPLFFLYGSETWSRMFREHRLVLPRTFLELDWTAGVRNPAEAKDFSLASVARPALRPTQASYPVGTGVLSPGVKRGRGVTLTTHPHLMPRS